eukprot:5838982-Pleurochrysis_carterae.AAC.2
MAYPHSAPTRPLRADKARCVCHLHASTVTLEVGRPHRGERSRRRYTRRLVQQTSRRAGCPGIACSRTPAMFLLFESLLRGVTYALLQL